MKKYIIKMGLSTLKEKKTKKQAMNIGKKNCPEGFYVSLYEASHEINGWHGLRINFIHRY